MKIESRLEKLEHELKILKNEIQATLLEIQEQLLIHYYPSLRAEDSAPGGASANGNLQPQRPAAMGAAHRGAIYATHQDEADGEPEAFGYERPSRHKPSPFAGAAPGMGGEIARSTGAVAHRRGIAATGRGNPHPLVPPATGTPAFMDIPFDDELLDGDEMDGNAVTFSPQTREVSLSEIKRGYHEPDAAPVPQRAQKVNFAALAEWVGQGIHTIGKERTRQAVETYAAAGYVAPEVQQMLVQLLTLSHEEGPVEPPGPTATIELLVKLDGLLNAQ